MSAGEAFALAMAIGLLSGAIGAALTVAIASQLHRLSTRKIHRTEAYARLLAARLTLSRAANTFVATFRALAAESAESRYFNLRSDAARSERARWFGAMRELDRAEAALVVWTGDPAISDELSGFHRIGTDAIRVAINGDGDDVGRLMEQLRRVDQLVSEFVQARTSERRPVWREWLRGAVCFVETIVDRWSRP